MIIQAAERFTCSHEWVATAGATCVNDRWLLVCHRCGHRTEQLPLAGLDRDMETVHAQNGEVIPLRPVSSSNDGQRAVCGWYAGRSSTRGYFAG